MAQKQSALIQPPKLATRGGAMILCVAFCILGLSGSANAKAKITTFDPSGSIATFPLAINKKGSIAGYYEDGSHAVHGFVRATDGSITAFDAPGSIGTFAFSVNRKGSITGYYEDSSKVLHGFLRTSDGTVTPFDVAGSIFTGPVSINDKGAIAGDCPPSAPMRQNCGIEVGRVLVSSQ